MLGRDIKVELRKKCEVDTFRWEKVSEATGATAIDADIVARDKLMDVALLKLRTGKEISPAANIFTDDIDNIKIGDRVVVCGAALGVPPIATNGNVVLTNQEIDNYDYLLISAPSIFGNSGGATFRRGRGKNKDVYELIGVPARITAVLIGFSPSPITHMGYSIRIDNILKFLDHNCYNFIYDNTHSIEEDEERRKKKIEKERVKREIQEGVVEEDEEEKGEV
jgi:S1-C subfamily serine protease